MKPSANAKSQKMPTIQLKSKNAKDKERKKAKDAKDKERKKAKIKKDKEMELKKKKKLTSNKEKTPKKTNNKKTLASEKKKTSAKKQDKDKSPERKKIKLGALDKTITPVENNNVPNNKRKAQGTEIGKPSKKQINLPTGVNKTKSVPSISARRNSYAHESREPSDASESIPEINTRTTTVATRRSSANKSEMSDEKTKSITRSSIGSSTSSIDLLSCEPSVASESISEMNTETTMAPEDVRSLSTSKSEVLDKQTRCDTIGQPKTNETKDHICPQNSTTDQSQIILPTVRIDLIPRKRKFSSGSEELDYDYDSDLDKIEALPFYGWNNSFIRDEIKPLEKKVKPSYERKSVEKTKSHECKRNAESKKSSPEARENVNSIEYKSKNSQLTSSMEEISDVITRTLKKKLCPSTGNRKTERLENYRDNKLKSPARVNLVRLTPDEVNSSSCSEEKFKSKSSWKDIVKHSRSWSKFISRKNSAESVPSDESDEMINLENKDNSDSVESDYSIEDEHYKTNFRSRQMDINKNSSQMDINKSSKSRINYWGLKSDSDDESNSREEHSKSEVEYNEKHSDSESNSESELSDKKSDFDEHETSKNTIESHKLNCTSENSEESDNNSSDTEHSEKEIKPVESSSSDSDESSDESFVFQKPLKGNLSENIGSKNKIINKQLCTKEEETLKCSERNELVDEMTDENLNLKSKTNLSKKKPVSVETTKSHSRLNILDSTNQASNYEIKANEKRFQTNEETSYNFNQNIIHKDKNDIQREFTPSNTDYSSILFRQKFRNNKTKSIILKNSDNSVKIVDKNDTNDSAMNKVNQKDWQKNDTNPSLNDNLDSDKKISQSTSKETSEEQRFVKPFNSVSKLTVQSKNNEFRKPNLPGKIATKNKTSVCHKSTGLERNPTKNTNSFDRISCLDDDLKLSENSRVLDQGEQMLNPFQTEENRKHQTSPTILDNEEVNDDVLSLYTTYTVMSILECNKNTLAGKPSLFNMPSSHKSEEEPEETVNKIHLEKLPIGKLPVFYGDTSFQDSKKTDDVDKSQLDNIHVITNGAISYSESNDLNMSTEKTTSKLLPDIKSLRRGSSVESSKSKSSLTSGSYKIPEVPVQYRSNNELKEQKSSSSCGSDELKSSDRSLPTSKSSVEVQTFGSCNRCGGKHPASRCPHFRSTCFKCDKRGHLYRMCPTSHESAVIFKGYCHSFLRSSFCRLPKCSNLHKVPDKNSISILEKPSRDEIQNLRNFLWDLSKPPVFFVTFLTKYLSSIQEDTELLHLANVLKNKCICHDKKYWYDIVTALSLCMKNDKMSAICRLMKHLVVETATEHQVVDKMVDMIVVQFSEIGNLWPVITILLEIPDYTLPTNLIEIFLRHILSEKKSSCCFMQEVCESFIKDNRVDFKALIIANADLVKEFQHYILSLKITNYAGQLKAIQNSCDQRRSNNVLEHSHSTNRIQHEYFKSSSDPLGISFENINLNLTNHENKKYISTNNVTTASSGLHNVPESGLALAEDSNRFEEPSIYEKSHVVDLRTKLERKRATHSHNMLGNNNKTSFNNQPPLRACVSSTKFPLSMRRNTTASSTITSSEEKDVTGGNDSTTTTFTSTNGPLLIRRNTTASSTITSAEEKGVTGGNDSTPTNFTSTNGPLLIRRNTTASSTITSAEGKGVTGGNDSTPTTFTSTNGPLLIRRNTTASSTITSAEGKDVTARYNSIPQYTNESFRKTNISTQPVFQNNSFARSPPKVLPTKSPSKITRTTINIVDPQRPPIITRTAINLVDSQPQKIPIQSRNFQKITNSTEKDFQKLNQTNFDTHPSTSSTTAVQRNLNRSPFPDVKERLNHLRAYELKFEEDKAVLVDFFQSPDNSNWRNIISIIEKWRNDKVISEKIANILYVAITKDKRRMVSTLNYFAHYVSGTTWTNNSLIQKTLCYLLYNVLLHAVGQDRWGDAFSVYKIISENRVDIKTVSVYNKKDHSEATKILICGEICFRVKEFVLAINLLVEYNLLYPKREQWRVKSEELDMDRRNHLVKLILESVKQYCHKNGIASNLFNLVVNAQENLQGPINLAEFYDVLQSSAFRNSVEKGLRFFEHTRKKCKVMPQMNKINYRAVVVASIKQYGPQTVKHLITRGTFEHVYPRQFQTNRQSVLMKSCWTIEEMEAVLLISLEQFSKEWDINSVSLPSLSIHIEFEYLTDDVPDILQLDFSLEEAKIRLSAALDWIEPKIKTNITTLQRNDCNIAVDPVWLANYLQIVRES